MVLWFWSRVVALVILGVAVIERDSLECDAPRRVRFADRFAPDSGPDEGP
jgi:hypothetical protein